MNRQRAHTAALSLLRMRLMAAAILLSQLAACAHRPPQDVPVTALQYSDEVSVCRAMLTATLKPPTGGLDPANISLFNWNVKKTREQQWREDFEQFAENADLVLFQEASLREENIAELDATRHWTFAPGYRRNGEVTGVMTLSSIKPLTQCSFMNYEPLLRSPKATSVMQYSLNETVKTLVVVNVHAVNFSLGLGAFRKQFEQIRRVLEVHDGPVILSGDFNTWRKKRAAIVAELAESLDLSAIEFANDNRVRIFGNAIDHIYVRGLDTRDADSRIVDSSDHNPMKAIFSIQGTATK